MGEGAEIETMERRTAKAVLFDAFGNVLMLRRSADSNNFAGKLDFPGGKVDGEDPLHGLIREIREETGIQIPPEYLSPKARSIRFYTEQVNGKTRIVRHISDIYTAEISRAERGEVRLRDGVSAEFENGKITPRLSKEHSEYIWLRPEDAVKDGYAKEFSTGLEGLYILASTLPGLSLFIPYPTNGKSNQVYALYADTSPEGHRILSFEGSIWGAAEFLMERKKEMPDYDPEFGCQHCAPFPGSIYMRTGGAEMIIA